MRKMIVYLLAATVLTACSSTDLLKSMNPFAEDKGIDASVQLGKNNTNVDNKGLVNLKDESKKTVNNDVKAEVVNQLTNEKDAPWLILAFAVAAGFAVQGIYARRQLKRAQSELDELQDLYKKEAEANGNIKGYVEEIRTLVTQNRHHRGEQKDG